jgi:hypothetical protein
MGKKPVLSGLLLAGMLLPGCEWSGKRPSVASRPSAPVYMNSSTPANTTAQNNNWNSGRNGTASTSSPFPNPGNYSNPKGSGDVIYNANGSNTPGGVNTPSNVTASSGTSGNRSTVPATDDASTTSRRAADSGILQAGGTSSNLRQPSYPASGGYSSGRNAPRSTPPSEPEPAKLETNEQPVLRSPQDSRPN